MIRILSVSILALALCGCMITNNDRAAVRAVRTYNTLLKKDTPAKLTIAQVLSRSDSQKHNALRRDLARLHCARELAKHYRTPLKENQLRRALTDAEKGRVSLNTALGFLPDAMIDYDTAGAFEVPGELPDVTKFEKAALVADATGDNALARLGKIRQLHAEAVASYDAVMHAKNDISRCRSEYQRLVRCTRLADAAGTTLADLPEIYSAAERFDVFQKRDITSH